MSATRNKTPACRQNTCSMFTSQLYFSEYRYWELHIKCVECN